MTKNLTKATFDESVNEGIVIVDFWAPWCGPCKMQTPILNKVSEKFKDQDDVTIARVDVDEDPELAVRFGIRSIPTLIVFKDGENIQQVVGLQQQSNLEQAINTAMATEKPSDGK